MVIKDRYLSVERKSRDYCESDWDTIFGADGGTRPVSCGGVDLDELSGEIIGQTAECMPK